MTLLGRICSHINPVLSGLSARNSYNIVLFLYFGKGARRIESHFAHFQKIVATVTGALSRGLRSRDIYSPVYRVLGMKTITISDEAYKKLESVKAGRSFSETIEMLISASVNKRIDRLLELGSHSTGREDELRSIVHGIRKRTRARVIAP